MGNPMHFERVMGPSRHIMENNGDLQPKARSMNPTLWVRSDNLSFGLLPYPDLQLNYYVMFVYIE